MRTCDQLGICQWRSANCEGCLPGVRVVKHTAAQWDLPISVPRLLHSIGSERQAGQEAGRGDAVCDHQVSGFTWPGRDFGVRAPTPDETPLSHDEAMVAVREGWR